MTMDTKGIKLIITVDGKLSQFDDSTESKISEYHFLDYDYQADDEFLNRIKAVVKKFDSLKMITADLIKINSDASCRSNLNSWRIVYCGYNGIEYNIAQAINGTFNFNYDYNSEIKEFYSKIKELQAQSINEFIKYKTEI
jgi:hypothetical protein